MSLHVLWSSWNISHARYVVAGFTCPPIAVLLTSYKCLAVDKLIEIAQLPCTSTCTLFCHSLFGDIKHVTSIIVAMQLFSTHFFANSFNLQLILQMHYTSTTTGTVHKILTRLSPQGLACHRCLSVIPKLSWL